MLFTIMAMAPMKLKASHSTVWAFYSIPNSPIQAANPQRPLTGTEPADLSTGIAMAAMKLKARGGPKRHMRSAE